MPDGSAPVLEAGVTLSSSEHPNWRDMAIGIPLALLKNPEGEHEIALNFSGAAWTLYVDGKLLDNDYAISSSGMAQSQYPANRPPMTPEAYEFLPLGAIKPTGWLKEQLKIQAAGLSGNLPSFWPDLGPKSGWLGGNGENGQTGPYYMDGLAAISYAPCRLKAKVKGGAQVDIEVKTDYPFDETALIKINVAQPTQFPLKLRIPSWAQAEERRSQARRRRCRWRQASSPPSIASGKAATRSN